MQKSKITLPQIITLQNEINNYKDKFYKTIKKTIDIEMDFEKM